MDTRLLLENSIALRNVSEKRNVRDEIKETEPCP